jgi:hypothetical protein
MIAAFSLAVPVVITLIALHRISAAYDEPVTHEHPVFIYEWALRFYLSSFALGIAGLIGILARGRYVMLWLPLCGITFSGICGFVALYISFGMRTFVP